MMVPKCKNCTWKIRSGNRSYCSHQAMKQTKKGIGHHVTTKEQNPSPSWCPLRKEGEA